MSQCSLFLLGVLLGGALSASVVKVRQVTTVSGRDCDIVVNFGTYYPDDAFEAYSNLLCHNNVTILGDEKPIARILLVPEWRLSDDYLSSTFVKIAAWMKPGNVLVFFVESDLITFYKIRSFPCCNVDRTPLKPSMGAMGFDVADDGPTEREMKQWRIDAREYWPIRPPAPTRP